MQVARVVAIVLAWAVVAATAGVVATQVAGWTGSRYVAVGQALTPVLGAASLLAAILGRVWWNVPLIVGGVAVAVAVGVVVAPAARRRSRPAGAPLGPSVRVLHGNLLFENVHDSVALAAAILATDADVLALSELHPDHEDALLAHPGATGYPHRIHRTSTKAEGMLLWSRQPVDDVRWEPMSVREGIVATIRRPDDGDVRIVLAHPNPPTTQHGLRLWEPSLRQIAEVGATPGPPTLVVADLNAARWHPPFRRLLRRGWRDVHEAVGRGLSVSWPTAGRWPIPFVRLDHGLAGPGLDVVTVRDIDLPGSDHRGFVVTIAPTRPTP